MIKTVTVGETVCAMERAIAAVIGETNKLSITVDDCYLEDAPLVPMKAIILKDVSMNLDGIPVFMTITRMSGSRLQFFSHGNGTRFIFYDENGNTTAKPQDVTGPLLANEFMKKIGIAY